MDRHVDRSFGGVRTEITCHNCGGHLGALLCCMSPLRHKLCPAELTDSWVAGHVFEGEGFKTPTDARHCVNSKSIKFSAAK